MTHAKWLEKVQRESDKTPDWLLRVLNSPNFQALHRDRDDGESNWHIFSTQEQRFSTETLREACRLFSDRFGDR